MSYKVTYTARFEKEAKRLAKKYPSIITDILNLVAQLKSDPKQGTPFGKNLYKIRLGIESKGQGKSGGARVISYVIFSQNTVFLTSIFDKSEQGNISTLALLKVLKEEGLIP